MPSATQPVAPMSAGGVAARSVAPLSVAEDLSGYTGLAPGWYQDTANPALARYWDGAALSEERRIVVAPRPSAAAGADRFPSEADAPCVPVWPDAVQLQIDLSPISASPPRFLPWGIGIGTPVASIAPLGYPAYVRILHPAGAEGASHGVPWRDVAAWSARTYHPLMQFEWLSTARFVTADPPPFDHPPPEGHLAGGPCDVLYAHLSRWTSTPDACWLGLWEGQANLNMAFRKTSALGTAHHWDPPQTRVHDAAGRWVEIVEAMRRAPRFALGGRRYLLARSSATAIPTLGRPPLSLTANLAWPDDRAWYVVSDIDFDSTLVATSNECANELLADDRLEALPVHALDRIDIDGDLLNADADIPR